MTIICSIILFTTWCFSFLNAICISKVPGHYINLKIQTGTARTAVYCLIKEKYEIIFILLFYLDIILVINIFQLSVFLPSTQVKYKSTECNHLKCKISRILYFNKCSFSQSNFEQETFIRHSEISLPVHI